MLADVALLIQQLVAHRDPFSVRGAIAQALLAEVNHFPVEPPPMSRGRAAVGYCIRKCSRSN